MATTAENTDRTLVKRAVKGDKGAFVEMLKLYDKAARTVAYAITLNSSTMEDVLQESYLKAFRSIGGLKDVSNPRAWLCRIVRNTALDEMRRRQRVVSLKDEYAETSHSREPHPEDVAVNGITVAQALAQLPEQQRLAIRLIDGEQLSYVEAAEILELPIGTVSSRVNSARNTLRALLSITNPEDTRQ